MTFLTVKPEKIVYTDFSKISADHSHKVKKKYASTARMYDLFLLACPFWKSWIKKVIPFIHGNKVLEVSFGNGYLMSQYASEELEVYGVDYNDKMIEIARKKLSAKNIKANLSLANVEKLPFPNESFDTVINTMSFSGYPDGEKAMAEINRVLKKDGTLLMIDFDYPVCRNIVGYSIVKFWESLGDIIKDINSLLKKHGFEYSDIPIGAYGSVHFFIAKKK